MCSGVVPEVPPGVSDQSQIGELKWGLEEVPGWGPVGGAEHTVCLLGGP